MCKTYLHLPVPKKNGAGFDDRKVTERLLDGKYRDRRERDVAYSAWMSAHSGRKTRQMSALAIPTAALGLMTAFTSDASTPPALVIAGLALVVSVSGTLVMITFWGRSIEAIEAAAAVHKHRINQP